MLKLYAARDRDGSLFIYNEEPLKDMDSGTWIGSFFKIDDSLFPDLEWKDEPFTTQLILRQEVLAEQ